MWNKRINVGVILLAAMLNALCCSGADISSDGWRLLLDKEATWKKDKLYLPEEAVDMKALPYNPPTGGWDALQDGAGISVELPATVEEYYWEKMLRKPHYDRSIKYTEGVWHDGFRLVGGYSGVSWWFKTVELPELSKGKRVILTIRAARFRAEVFLNEKLVGYSTIAEVPFFCDITEAVQSGENKLAIRITNPGGNYNWIDFTSTWAGTTTIPMSHNFGGLDSGISLEVRESSYVEYFAILNKQELGSIQIQADIRSAGKAFDGLLEVVIDDTAGKRVFQKQYPVKTEFGKTTVFNFAEKIADVKAWDLDTPVLYHATVKLVGMDRSEKNVRFGFRTYEVVGIGDDAYLKVNGKRVVLKGMISWGYWGPNGLFPEPELAAKGVKAAKELGLNCMNWHRNLGDPLTMDAADEYGVYVYEEPGSGAHAFEGHKPELYFASRYMAHKIWRMVRRDRNHPSVLHFNMCNEKGPSCTDEFDKEVFNEVHRLAPDRSLTLISGVNLDSSEWRKDVYERNQASMRPWDNTIYEATDGRQYPGQSQISSRNSAGWYSEHSVNGSGVWKDFRYNGKEDFWHKSREKAQIMSWGEMGGFGAPDQYGKAIAWYEKNNAGRGYGLRDARRIHEGYKDYLGKYGFCEYFEHPDDLFFAAGNKSYSTWSKVMEVARADDENDILTGNGWDSTNFDNHSGVVDGLRNFKGNPALMAEGFQPLMISILPHRFIVPQGGEVNVDFRILNENDLHGDFMLHVASKTPSGKIIDDMQKRVSIEGGVKFSQLLTENVQFKMPEAGMATIEAMLKKGKEVVLEREIELHIVDYSVDTDKKVYLVEDENEIKTGLDKIGIETVSKPEDADLIIFSTKTAVYVNPSEKPIVGGVFTNVANANLMGTFFKLEGLVNGPAEVEFTFPQHEDMLSKINVDINHKRVINDLRYDAKAASASSELEILKHKVQVDVEGGELHIKAAEVNRAEVIQRRYIDLPRRMLRPQVYLLAVKVTDSSGKVHRYVADFDDVTDDEGHVWAGVLYNPNKILEELFQIAKENAIPIVGIYDHNRAYKGAPLLGMKDVKAGAESHEPWMGGWYFTRKHSILDGLPVGDVMDWKYQAASTYGQDHFYGDWGGSSGHGTVFDADNLDVAVAIGADHQGRPGHTVATWNHEGVDVTMINMPQFVRGCGEQGWGFNHYIALKMLGNAIKQ